MGGQDAISPTYGVSILTGMKKLYRQRWEEGSKQNSFVGGAYQCQSAYSAPCVCDFYSSTLVLGSAALYFSLKSI